MRLSDLVKKTKIIQITLGESTADLEYRIYAVTPAFLEEMKTLSGMDAIIKQIETVVVRWELIDDDDREILVTRDAIMENGVPTAFLYAVLLGIQEDVRGDSEQKNA